MAGEKTYLVIEQAKKGLRWLVWKPLRLVVLIVAILIVWIVASNLGGDPGAGETPTGTITTDTALPSGWQTWPTIPATTGAPSPTSTAPTTSAPPQASPSATPVTPTGTAGASGTQAVWDDASRQAALDTGVAAVAAYTGGDQAGLDKMLGWDVAIPVRHDLVTISTPDPARPGAPVPHIDSEFTPLATTVIVPTSGGDYKVSITRWSGTDPWLVQAITRPE